MTSQQLSKECEDVLDQAINGKSLNQPHLSACQQCRHTLATIQAIRELPAVSAAEYPALKSQVMKRLIPILKEKYADEKPVSFLQSWFFRLALGAAALVMVFAVSFPMLNKDVPVEPRNSLPIVLTQNFKISVNGGAVKDVSLDNPVSLLPGEKATITIPDGSSLQVEGPARLTIAPRGFHLTSGFLTASVVKNPQTFAASTPHGQIFVLGTVFSCDSTTHKTVVKVIEGRVKVKPDQGSEKVLSAGESVEMQADTVNASETIPSIDSE
ncbi:MAG: FecR family protein [Candidatus Riflebacteria bacterium]